MTNHASLVLPASLSTALAIAAALAVGACATSPTDDAALTTDESETRAAESAPPPQKLPASNPVDPDAAAEAPGAGEDAAAGPGGNTDGGADASGGEGGSATDAGITGPQNVVIRLVPTRSDWLVAGQPAPFKVLLDAKNCNLFGNSCDANVALTLTIDAPATSPSASASCTRLQSGTGVRQCVEGSAVTKAAVLTPGQDVLVRFHAEAVDDPGTNPSCDIDKTWTFTGTGFTLKGETFPALSYWGCVGSGSGQNLDVLLGYKLAL